MIKSTILGGVLTLALGATALGSAALAQSDPAAAPMGASTSPPPMSGPLSTPDFITAASQSDEFEIQEGQLAQSMSTNSKVKSFGAMMVQDHTMTTNNLHKAIVAAGMTPPPPPPLRPAPADKVAALQAMSGKAFDKAFVDQQVAAHEEALAVQTNYSQTGDTPAIKKAAAKTVPVVQRHLTMARQMQQKMMQP